MRFGPGTAAVSAARNSHRSVIASVRIEVERPRRPRSQEKSCSSPTSASPASPAAPSRAAGPRNSPGRQPPHHRRGPHRRGPGRRRQRLSRARRWSEGGVEAAAAASRSASVPTSRRASPRSCGNTPSGRAAAASVEHAISGIDIALWDLFGKITQPAGRRGCSAATTAHRSSPMARSCSTKPDPLREKLQGRGRARVQGDQARLAAVRPARCQDRRTARSGPPAKRSGRTSR